jgi:hypothetical protein
MKFEDIFLKLTKELHHNDAVLVSNGLSAHVKLIGIKRVEGSSAWLLKYKLINNPREYEINTLDIEDFYLSSTVSMNETDKKENESDDKRQNLFDALLFLDNYNIFNSRYEIKVKENIIIHARKIIKIVLLERKHSYMEVEDENNSKTPIEIYLSDIYSIKRL